MDVTSADVVVVGGGAAGIWAAMAARRKGATVLLVDKGHSGYSGSSFYFLNRSWGYQTVLPGDSPETRNSILREMTEAGGDELNAPLAGILVDESWPQLEELLRWGASLRMSGGSAVRVRGCFGEGAHACCVENHRSAFRRIVRSLPALNRWTALQILKADGRAIGVWGVDRGGRPSVVLARAVIVATGGAVGLFNQFLGNPGALGLGYALAAEAGATLKGLEFIQFMLAKPGRRYAEFFACNEMGEGGAAPEPELLDALRRRLPPGVGVDRVYADRAHHFPFSTRDSSRYFDEAVAGSPRARVWLNHGRNVSQEIFHAAHAFNGGIVTDEWGRTAVEGLYAVGEAAGGIHGADRLGGTMIPACLVFGRRAGEDAAQVALRDAHRGWMDGRRGWKSDLPSLHDTESRSLGALEELRASLSTGAGIIRTASGLHQCIDSLRAVFDENSRAMNGGRAAATAHVARLASLAGMHIARAALDRTESKGPHYRADTAAYLKDPPAKLQVRPRAAD